MINSKNGEYAPIPTSNRKLVRRILRAQVLKNDNGVTHNTSAKVAAAYKNLKEKKNEI